MAQFATLTNRNSLMERTKVLRRHAECNVRKIALGLVLLSACVLSVASAWAEEPAQSAYPAGKIEEELIKLDKEWAAAEAKNDVEALSRILADDYAYTDTSGRAGDKRQFMASLKAKGKQTGHGEMATDNYAVRVYGDSAVMTHRVVQKGTDFTDQKHSMHVWVRRDGRWQVVAHQWTSVAFPEMPKEPFLNQACAKNSFQPEVFSYFGDSETVISKLDKDQMGLPDRRGYFLVVETRDSAELVTFERADNENARVSQWRGGSLGDLREKLTDTILANRGIACIGEQSKAIVKARFNPEERGIIPSPVSARAAFSHILRKYDTDYLRVTVFLLC